VTLPVRARAPSRRRERRVARASAGISATRALAAVSLLAAASALYGVSASAAFELDRLEVRGTGHTAPETVRQALAATVGERPNLFRLRTAEVSGALRALPAVRAAEVRVTLPDRLLVTVSERAPILVWQTGRQRFLVDVEGKLFVLQPASRGEVRAPVVVDRRSSGRALQLGATLDPTDLAVARQLAALAPAFLASGASRLSLTVDDREGYVLAAEPHLWRAVFGFYTPRMRKPDLVPGQVQCLKALLASGERELRAVYLGRPGDRCGAFTRKEQR
jgi:cell division septal protein FtsQ